MVRGKIMVGISMLGVSDLIGLQLLNSLLCIGFRDNSNSRCSITKAIRTTHTLYNEGHAGKNLPGSAGDITSQL